MKKAIVYIDGYNLYFGLLKDTCWKWLDLWKFAECLLDGRYELVEVVYFTAPIKTHPVDLAASERQNAYIQAVSTRPGVRIVQGFYSKQKMRAPYVSDKCASCDVAEDGLVQVYKMEEKWSDVNLAVTAVMDAADNRADCFVFVTGDSDQVGAIDAVRYKYGKTVVVFNPHASGGKHLKRAATFFKYIPRDLPAKCQLPEVIPVGTRGNVIRCPEAWRSTSCGAGI